MKRIITLSLSMALIGLLSCSKDNKTEPTNLVGDFVLELDHNFGSSAFGLNTDYTTIEGEIVNFTTLKYYISNVVITRDNGTTWSPAENYFLIDLSNPASAEVLIPQAPKGSYTSISFVIGVDSTRNVSGVQDGALSVSNNMFWSWNTGYIFAKFEGNSPASSTGTFSYHLGGFKYPNDAAQRIQFNFSNDHHGQTMNIAPNAKPQLHTMVDIAKLFEDHHGGHSNLKVATTPKLHMPGAMAAELMHNFAEGFTLDHLHN